MTISMLNYSQRKRWSAMSTKVYTLQRRLEAEQKRLLKQLENNLDVADEAHEMGTYLLKQHLREVEYALHKFELGTYGLCDVCSQPIKPERLEALPWASLCLSCKARQEKKNTNGKTHDQFHHYQYYFDSEGEEEF